jgi:electron transfer flavoprotein beta subunit
MKIGVCVKVSPDLEQPTPFKITAEGLDTSSSKFVLNPWDENALEEAIRCKEANGGEVVVISVGPKSTVKQLRTALALGAERAILVTDDAVLGSDSLAIARSLAKAAEGESFDILFCGRQSESDSCQVASMVSELLGWGLASFVTEFSCDGSSFQATRRFGSAEQVIKGNLPVVVTCEDSLNTPRYAKLPAIMKAKRKKIDEPTLADLGLGADDIAPAVTATSYAPPPARPKGRILQGDVDSQVKELVKLLREEAKVL